MSFNKAMGAGFGFTGNYTYSDAKADNGDPIPGNSKRTWNIAGYFENPTFSTRLAYTYRSDFFVTFDRSTQLNQKELTELDASFAWNVTPAIAATFDAINITDEKIEQFAGEEFRHARDLRQRPGVLRGSPLQVLSPSPSEGTELRARGLITARPQQRLKLRQKRRQLRRVVFVTADRAIVEFLGHLRVTRRGRITGIAMKVEAGLFEVQPEKFQQRLRVRATGRR